MNENALTSSIIESFPAHPSQEELTRMGLYNNPAGISVWYRRKYAELRQWVIELAENTNQADQGDPDTGHDTPTR